MEQTEEDRKGMEAALERARENPQHGEWDSQLEKLSSLWGDEKPIEEVPTKMTGDESHEMEGLDLSDPNAVQLRKPGAGALDVISGGSTEEPKSEDGMPPPMPPPEIPTEPWAKLKYELEQQHQPKEDPLAAKMTSVGWAPKESSAPPDWEQLQKNLQDAQGRAEAMRTVQQSFHAVAPRFQADPNAGAEDIAAAKAPLEVAQDKQRFEAQQQASQAQQIAAHEKLLADAKSQARLDPTSTESQHARDALRPLFERAGGVPEGFEKWNAEDVDQHAKLLTPIAGQLTQEHIAQGKEAAAAAEKKAAADAKQAEKDKNAAAEAKSLEDERSLILSDPRAKTMGIKPEQLDGLDRKGLDEFRKQLDSIKQAKPGAGTGPAKAIHAVTDVADPNDRARVQMLLEGRASPEEFGRKDGPRLAGYAAQINPQYDPEKARLGKDVRAQIAKDGSIDSINTAQDHIDEARRLIPQNFDSQFMNKLKSAVLTGTGSPELTKFQDTLRVAAAEYSKALGENAEAGKQEIAHLLDPVQSPAQMKDALDQIDRLLSGRIHAITRRYKEYAPEGVAVPQTLQGREKGEGPPASGTVTVFDTKSRTSKNVSKEKADAIMKADKDKRFQVIGEPNP